ncbi:MAG: BrnA antitoxin family protein [Candidatus Binatia bacterium]
MKKEHDFSKGKRGPVIPAKGKTRITIYLDDDVLEEFRDRADATGRGYQTMINDALRAYLGKATGPVDEETLRRVLREELSGPTSAST